jgi:hypothetical protein
MFILYLLYIIFTLFCFFLLQWRLEDDVYSLTKQYDLPLAVPPSTLKKQLSYLLNVNMTSAPDAALNEVKSIIKSASKGDRVEVTVAIILVSRAFALGESREGLIRCSFFIPLNP